MRKVILFVIAIVMIASYSLTAQVAVNNDGTNPDGSAMLDVNSSSLGFLPPRMTSTERDAISSPADGLLIFNITTNSIEFFAGGFWNYINGNPYITTIYNSITGETWIDRNLGASQVADSSSDVNAYGDLYQWGRLTDGHESRTSGTTTTLSSTDDPGHSNFIVNTTYPADWRNPKNDNLWQGINGINNPCPSGYRIPTIAEWEDERATWTSNNAAGAYASLLKLTVGGLRNQNGIINNDDSYGYYWTMDIINNDAKLVYISSIGAGTSEMNRVVGFSVRCLKD